MKNVVPVLQKGLLRYTNELAKIFCLGRTLQINQANGVGKGEICNRKQQDIIRSRPIELRIEIAPQQNACAIPFLAKVI